MRRSRKGATFLEIVAWLVILGLGVGIYFGIGGGANAFRANLESVDIISIPSEITNGQQRNVRVEIAFDRALARSARRSKKVTLQLWEDDGPGFDEMLLEKGVGLKPGSARRTVTVQLSCDAKGLLNGDDDDGDREYEVYAYVVDAVLGETVTEKDNNTLDCVAPEEQNDR